MLLPGTAQIDLQSPLASFKENGFARLGSVMDLPTLAKLRQRANAIMLGEKNDLGFFFQHDSGSGRYEDLEYGQGWQGPSLAYRKIEKLEQDPLFLSWIENDLFARIARDTLGDAVTIYRAVLWNKAAGGGTRLPWHQDDGPFWGLDRPPNLQIWTALDDVPIEAGCLEVLPGSHHEGLATPDGGTVPSALVDDNCGRNTTTLLPAKAGESVLLHNHTWHRSAKNETQQARRAISISFLSADTRCTRKRRAPRTFRPVFE
jgi:phytanoyl-CoA hydroxylase